VYVNSETRKHCRESGALLGVCDDSKESLMRDIMIHKGKAAVKVREQAYNVRERYLTGKKEAIDFRLL
jgi:hypothetical protein